MPNELTKEQLETKVAYLSQQNAVLQDQLLDIKIAAGLISLQQDAEPVESEETE